MKTLLILIGADPRVSTRPAEAMRVAAGVGAWQKVRVSVYFEGEALRCLTDAAEDLEGGQLLTQYIPMIKPHGGQIYVPRKHSFDLTVETHLIDNLAELIRGADYYMNFDAAAPTIESCIGSDYDRFLANLFA